MPLPLARPRMVAHLENLGNYRNQLRCTSHFHLLAVKSEYLFVTSRSYMPEGVRSKSWQDRMEKTKKAAAIKKLQTELKEEKKAEFMRY